MQIIKSCRCRARYGAKSYVFMNNFKDSIQISCAFKSMSSDYVIL